MSVLPVFLNVSVSFKTRATVITHNRNFATKVAKQSGNHVGHVQVWYTTDQCFVSKVKPLLRSVSGRSDLNEHQVMFLTSQERRDFPFELAIICTNTRNNK
jgi:hypothetical protein